jgi:hypothetical protein
MHEWGIKKPSESIPQPCFWHKKGVDGDFIFYSKEGLDSGVDDMIY